MKLYHHTTWNGERINDEGVIKPSRRYGFSEVTILTPWPDLIFLTTNPVWEPSIQAKSKEGYYEKCGSCPEVYAELGIPLHTFEVEVSMAWYYQDFMHLSGWCEMLIDAVRLGSNINEWRIYDEEIKL